MHKGHLNAQRANTRSTKKTFKSPNFPFNITQLKHPNSSPALILANDDELPSTPSPSPTRIPPANNPSLLLTSTPQSSSLTPQQSPPPSLPVQQELQHASYSPISPHENQRTHFVYPACITPTGTISTDQTGAFPISSISGNKYIFVIYDYDSNLIYGIPISSRSKAQLTHATSSILTLLKSRGLQPKLQRLDNEISKELEHLLHKEGVNYQLTPTGMHQRNSAEKAIQIYKNHFIAGLCTTNPTFPTNLWDKLVPQANITLNLMRPSRINPQLSAYAQVFGAFDYNKTPLTPPGLAVLSHVRPEKRTSWSPHALSGFYLGPAMNHYRNHRVAERIADKLQWLPQNNIRMPTSSRNSIILAAASDLTNAIKSQHSNPLLPPVSTQTRIVLHQLDSIFQNKLKDIEQSTSSMATPLPIPLSTQPRSRMVHWNTTLIQPPSPLNPIQSPPISSLRSSHPSPPPLSIPPSCPAPLPRVHTIQPATPLPSINLPLSSVPLPVPLPRVHPSPSLPVAPLRRSNPTLIRNPRYVTNAALNAVLNPSTGQLEQYKQLIQGKDFKLWTNGMSKEMARLTQGRSQNDVPYHNVMTWMHPNQLPKGLKATYMRVCANFWPQKSDPYPIRCTMGGNLVTPKGPPTHFPTADLTLFKLFINSVISTPNAKFMDLDLKDFYICHDKEDYDFMLVPYSLFPQDIIDQYYIKSKVDDRGLVLAEVHKASMYGHPEAGRISYDALVQHLAKADYFPAAHTPGLFKHKTNSVQFILVVDDFGIKYINKSDAQHLIDHLKTKYTVTEDWDGKLFCGITLNWDYINHKVQLSMPNYVSKAGQRFGHTMPTKPQHSPHTWTPPQYGAKIQMTTPLPLAFLPLDKTD